MTNLAKHYQNAITYAYSEQTLMAPSNMHIATAINNRVDFAYGLAKTPGALLFVPFGDDYAEPYTAVGAHLQVLNACEQVYLDLTNMVAWLEQYKEPRTLFQVLATDPDHDPALADRCSYVAYKFVDHGTTFVHELDNVPVGNYRVITEHEELEYGVGSIMTFWLLPANK